MVKRLDSIGKEETKVGRLGQIEKGKLELDNGDNY
jgi:hypothetical protein